MKTYLECIPCFVRQALEAARDLGLDDEAAGSLLRRTLGLALRLDWNVPPPVMGRDIHRLIREVMDDADPYLRRKISDTDIALGLLPRIEEAVTDSAHPFLTAVKFSIAGNSIDLGAKTHRDIDVEEVFRSALNSPVDGAAVDRLARACADAGNVLFLADNAGEIVFDRPLLEQIGPDKITVVVRGAPAINDATLDDARRSGLTDRFRVISNGSDTPGTWLDECSESFNREFEKAELVIAKGQGNYETLNDQSREVFFLFKVKCDLVADELDVPKGTYVARDVKTG